MTYVTQETQLLQEGDMVVSVVVELTHDDQNHWGPTYAPTDVQKLVLARRALRQGDLAEAATFGKLYKLLPVELPHKRAS